MHVSLTPPSWLPPEDMDLWEKAVTLFETQGKKPTYPAVVAVYKNYLKREGRERQQNLPGFNDRALTPGQEKALQVSNDSEMAGSGAHMIDERAVTGGFKALNDYRKKAVSPPGWEGSVKKMKKHPEIDNPWALSWHMKNKGYTPGGKKSSFKALAAYRKKAGPDDVQRYTRVLDQLQELVDQGGLGGPLPSPHGSPQQHPFVEPWERALQSIRQGINDLKDLINQGAIVND